MEINKLIKLEKYCEGNKKCPNCNNFSLVGCNPEDLLFLCSNCGSYLEYNEETDEIIELESKEEDK